MEMPEESSWTQHDNTMLTKNNAFGKITFDVEVSTKSKRNDRFSEASMDYRCQKLYNLPSDVDTN